MIYKYIKSITKHMPVNKYYAIRRSRSTPSQLKKLMLHISVMSSIIEKLISKIKYFYLSRKRCSLHHGGTA